jgi:hypothetical protein
MPLAQAQQMGYQLAMPDAQRAAAYVVAVDAPGVASRALRSRARVGRPMGRPSVLVR